MVKQSWFQLTAIQSGNALCLPMLMAGQILAQTYGVFAVIPLLIGNGILYLISLGIFFMSFRERKTTVEHAKEYFGAVGSSFFSVIIGLCMLGWFVIQMTFMHTSLKELLPISNSMAVTLLLLLGCAITIATSYGVKALDRVARLSICIFSSCLIYNLVYGSHKLPLNQGFALSGSGISLVIATTIAFTIDIPTYYRFATTKKDGFISLSILFLLWIPLIQGIGILIGSGQGNLITILAANSSLLVKLWLMLGIALTIWTTNNMNLYSSAIAIQQSMPFLSFKQWCFILGFTVTILACFVSLDDYQVILEGMGIMLASMSACIMTNFLLKHKANSAIAANIFCWFVGSALGILSLMKVISITSSAVVDAWLISAFAVLVIKLIMKLIGKKQ